MKNIFLVFLLTGCVGLGDMKLRDGEAGCDTVNSVYGSASRIVYRADNPPKGTIIQAGRTRITCGSAIMEMDSSIGAQK